MHTSALRSLQDLSPTWLETALAPAHPDVRVRAVSIQREVHGTATKALLRIAWDGPCPLPEQMWLKSGLEPHSPLMGTSGLYAHEARVYTELLPNLPVRRPDCYGAGWDADGQGWLLLEALRGDDGAEIFTPMASIGRDDVARQIENLAALHAATGVGSGFQRPTWVKTAFGEHRDPQRQMGRLVEAGVLESLLTQPRCREFPSAVRDPTLVVAALDRLANWLAGAEGCLLHGDAHIGNSYRTAQGCAGLFDWQIPRWGAGIFDVAYYLVSALEPTARRQAEGDLLERYHTTVLARGGRAPSHGELWQGYRACLVYGFAAWLANPVELQPEDFNAIISTRFAVAMIDHSIL